MRAKDFITEDAKLKRDIIQFLKNMGFDPVEDTAADVIRINAGNNGTVDITPSGNVVVTGVSHSPVTYRNEQEFRRGMNFVHPHTEPNRYGRP